MTYHARESVLVYFDFLSFVEGLDLNESMVITNFSIQNMFHISYGSTKHPNSYRVMKLWRKK